MIRGLEQRAAVRILTLGLLVAGLMAVVSLLASGPTYAKTFTVTSKQDFSDFDPGDGICDTQAVQLLNPCTLRGAIQEANEFTGADTIHFDIYGSGVKTIEPKTQLPVVTAPVTIDGYTQPGAIENTLSQGNNAVLRIELDGTNSSASQADGLIVSASNAVIRGIVINRFDNEGIQLSGSNNKVEGNFIGTEASGLGTNEGPQDPGNSLSGVIVASGESGNTIGGTTPAASNIISANGGAGVMINSASNNKVQGNLIGPTRNWLGNLLGNRRSGVEIRDSSDNTVGGNTPEASNTIAGNGNSFDGGNGVTVTGASSTGNRILRNSIAANEDLGIDLANAGTYGDGVTPNDAKDPDTGANGLQNFPVLTSATISGGETTIKGKLNSKPNKSYVLQFFAPNPIGVGRPYRGQKSVTTNKNGNVTFSFSPADGFFGSITATATDPNGNTSEFSAPKTVTSPR